MKQSELLRKQADMMDMAEKYGVDDWRKLVGVSQNNVHFDPWSESGCDIGYWKYYRFALGVVEGKPVFEGDEFYISDQQIEITGADENGSLQYVAYYPNGVEIAGSRLISCYGCQKPEMFSWTPKKPNTVMVELLREDAETLKNWVLSPPVNQNIAEACRKALEESCTQPA